MPAPGRLVLAVCVATGLAGPVGTRAAPLGRAASAAPACADATLEPTPDNIAQVRVAVVCLLNQTRAQAGRPPLRDVSQLDESSRGHSEDMVTNHYLAHEKQGRPTLLQRITASGYFRGALDAVFSENVGVAPREAGDAATLVHAWMGSEDHRANILHPALDEIGVGLAFAAPDPAFYADYPSVLYTTDFGNRTFAPARPRKVRCVRRRAGTKPSPRRRYCRRRVTASRR
jgi:uncharacterized protein YkwD